MQTQVQLSALQHHGIVSMIEKGLNMLEGFGQNFSYLPLRPGQLLPYGH